MDWIQFPFEVDCKFHLGAGAPIVRQRWMFTDQPFLPLGTECVFMNRIWDEDQVSELPVGQLPLDAARFKQDARWRLPAGMRPGHMCHPEWLATGEPWPSALPPAVYGPFWIPECCGLFQDQPAGGLAIGGECGDIHTGTDATAGGLVVGGSAGDLAAYLDATAGGLVVGGSAGDLAAYLDATAGGLVVGGSAGDVWENGNDPTAGGLVVGGECGDVYTPPGGAMFENGTFDIDADKYAFGVPSFDEVSQEFTVSGGTLAKIVFYEASTNFDDGFFDLIFAIGTTPFGRDVVTDTFDVASSVYIGDDSLGRRVFEQTINLASPIVLGAGTFWLTFVDSFGNVGGESGLILAGSGAVDAEWTSGPTTITGGVYLLLEP